MNSAKDYSVVIKHGLFEGEKCFEARVIEFPDLAEYADTYGEAYELIIDSITRTCDYLRSKGKHSPKPSKATDDDYSGRVTLRMPKSLHKEVSIEAQREETSLNQYLLATISLRLGFQLSERRYSESNKLSLVLNLIDNSDGYSNNFHVKNENLEWERDLIISNNMKVEYKNAIA